MVKYKLVERKMTMIIIIPNNEQIMIENINNLFLKYELAFHQVSIASNCFYIFQNKIAEIVIKDLVTLSEKIEIVNIDTNYKLTNYKLKEYFNNIFNTFTFKGHKFIFIAGPCAIESSQQMDDCLKMNQKLEIPLVRGGIVKPRTSPYSYQGDIENGLSICNELKIENLVSEVMTIQQVEEFKNHVHIYQIGARNMQNFDLLKAVGKTKKPVILKRNPSATIEEWLLSAEYIMLQGNPNIALCERGIRTYENSYRNTLDLNAVAYLKTKTHLPIIVDPSHGTGDASMVLQMSLASIAAQADGIMVESHPTPSLSISDASQTINFEKLEELSIKAQNLLNLRSTYEDN